jgi:hypothetical protein
MVEEPWLQLLQVSAAPTVYELALSAVESGQSLTHIIQQALVSERIDYDSVYQGRSEWRLLVPFDHSQEPARCLVSGTGLTHKASADNRSAMHDKSAAQITDSMRMYQMGIEGGRPAPGHIGVQPEWFYKGSGTILRAHGEPLDVPRYARDGGEEPEIAAAYLISESGVPHRIGFATANEFSDHVMEKQNYLYLAPSKLRTCSIGPELSVGDFPFDDLPGEVSIYRSGATLWSKQIRSGENNMCHSLANLEHHHFKYAQHRRPGDAHIHFFGASAFSFGEGLALEDGDLMQVSFPALGRPLRNPLRHEASPEMLISVRAL